MQRDAFDPGKMKQHRSEPDPDLDRLAFEVIGAAIEVHRELGPGLLEAKYERALGIELSLQNIPYVAQHPCSIQYKGHSLGDDRIDLLIDNRLVVELKAVDHPAPVHTAQVLSYLRATQCELGLLINFNVPVLKDGIRRIVLSQP